METGSHFRSSGRIAHSRQALLGFTGQSEFLTGREDVDTEKALAVPWREAFPPLDDAERPARLLRAARTREDLTQMQLARLTGIPQRHLSEMEHGKRTIGKERAKKLAEVLQVDYHHFL
jgi:ribosome-binding protein aMBF1 (putative translation factor)